MKPLQQSLPEGDAAHQYDSSAGRDQANAGRDGKIAGSYMRDVKGFDSERAWVENIGDEVTDQRGDADGSERRHRICPDHELEGIERPGKGGSERAGDGGCRSAA